MTAGRVHYLYAQYVNRLHGRSGHVWRGRFFSCVLDEGYARAALRYVECNPVRAALRYVECNPVRAKLTGRRGRIAGRARRRTVGTLTPREC